MMFKIAGKYADALRDAAVEFKINTPDRIAMWLAQLAHESGGFRLVMENLNYSEEGLRKTWPQRFNDRQAHEYANQEERIANRVYGGRMGNGGEDSGDGWRYRGRGFIQLTGRGNYVRYGNIIAHDLVGDPDQLCKNPTVMALVAGAFWEDNNCNELSDRGEFGTITKKINGGFNGLADRQNWLSKIRSLQK